MHQIQWLDKKQILSDPSYPFTKGQLDHFLLHRHRNGLQVAVRRLGKKIVLRKDLLDAWIESKSEGQY